MTPTVSFSSSKVYDGFSTCFRQWKADDTHCRFLHGYGVSFRVWFEGEVDHRNWIYDFGGMKRAKTKIDGLAPNEWIKFMFDHTVIVAEDDPFLQKFIDLYDQGVIQLRVLPAVGAEKFAEFLAVKLNSFVVEETQDRVRVSRVEFREHDKNAATVELKANAPTALR